MKTMTLMISLMLAVILMVSSADDLVAQKSNSHKKEFSQLHKDLSKVTSVIRHKKYDEAGKMLDAIQDRLEKYIIKTDLGKSHKGIQALEKVIALKRQTIEKLKDPKGYKEKQNRVSFVKHVAPILNKHCVKCHSDDPQGKLHLDSFAEMKKGGESGPLLAVGNANRSLMMARLIAPEKDRMPQKAAALSRNEIAILALWINQGAKFDGEDEEQELSEMLKPKEDLPPLKYAKATGNEKVSFKKDIAPFMVKYCQRCHQGKKPGGGLYLTSYDTLMRGGDKGLEIIPGKPDKSRLFQLMSSMDESMRMPLEGKVHRKNYDDINTWISEGARYDGDDPRTPLRALNPSEGQMLAAEMKTFTPEQLVKYRKERSDAQWKKAFPDTEPLFLETDNFFFYTNVPEERFKKIQKWPEDQIESLRKVFAIEEGKKLWKGKLTVFILADHDSYEQFNKVVTQRRINENSVGNFVVTGTQDDAFVVLEDIGDKSNIDAPALQLNFIIQTTNAYITTSQASFPEWFTLGIGLALSASEASRKDPYLQELRFDAIDSLEELEKPTDVFNDGAFFSSEKTLPVGFTLAEFLLKKGGQKKLSAFIKAMEQGGEVGNSLRVVYGIDLAPIAQAYFSSFKKKRRPKS